MTDYSDADFNAMQERTEQTLADIQNLQQIEQELYTSLEQGSSSNTLSSTQKTSIINKINEIYQMRANLYTNLKDMYSFFQTNVASSRTTLAEQMMAIDIVENELNDAKKRLSLLEEQKNNKLRLVEINTYYGKKYDANAGIMKTIVFTCIPILILTLLVNNGFLPSNITSILIIIIILIGLVLVGMQIIDLSNRDNMNFDEYDWNFNSNNAPSNNTTPTATDPWSTGTCIGAACCNEAEQFDTTQNLCIPLTSCQ